MPVLPGQKPAYLVHPVRYVQVALEDAGVNGKRILRGERRVARRQLENQHTEGPPTVQAAPVGIDTKIVRARGNT